VEAIDINPDATETWYDGVDQDCAGDNDFDWDHDTYVRTADNASAGGTAPNINDCDDDPSTGSLINPGATDTPGDGIDQDCTGYDAEIFYVDADNDDYGNDSGTIGTYDGPLSDPPFFALTMDDCNDTDPDINPGATDIPGNGIDEDCSGADTPLLDFGDAPSSYATLLANDGARHVLGGDLFLGAAVDNESEGQPNATATGDDLAGATPDDEDGVVFQPIIAGQTGEVYVTASGPGLLNAWIDFDRSGDWSVDDRILDDVPVVAGVNVLSFPVPVNLTPGESFARFRLDSGGGLAPTGLAADGEVEDVLVMLYGADSDGDGIGDQDDNCPNKRNAAQADKDGDGIGNKCDPDIDGDLVLNITDNCPNRRNASQADKDPTKGTPPRQTRTATGSATNATPTSTATSSLTSPTTAP